MEPLLSPVRETTQSAPINDLSERFRRLKERVLAKRPVLREIIEKRGSKQLLQYASEYVDVNLTPTIPQRMWQMLSVIRQVTEERFGKGVAESVIRQLEKYYFVSTADHDGPITHPFFVNSNLLTAASLMSRNDPILENVIVLACANISVDNSSFPRGLFFHNMRNGEFLTHRMSFFSANARPASIYTMRPYGKADLTKIRHGLETSVAKGEIREWEFERVRSVFDEVYDRPEILTCPTYMEQVSRTNHTLWKKFFVKSGVKLPNLVYLELEDIVTKLIINYHLYHDTVINHVLFDQKYEPYINTYFENIFGSFSRREEAGTYLFWALPKGAKHNLQLWRKGNFLVSKDESYKVELRPEALRDAMERKELIPSLLLDFMVVSFYYGLKCLGGFNQVNYLTLMKNAYIKMNTDLGNYRSIEICARAQTKEIVDGLSVAFLGYGDNKMALASGLDLILYDEPGSLKEMLDLCRTITLDDSVNPLMPEIYRISYDKKEWEEDLASIRSRDISRLTGLDCKTRPCVRLPQ